MSENLEPRLDMAPSRNVHGPEDGWAVIRASWHFHRSLWRLHRISLGYGEYTRLRKQIEAGEAEQVSEIPPVWKVHHAETDILMIKRGRNLVSAVRTVPKPKAWELPPEPPKPTLPPNPMAGAIRARLLKEKPDFPEADLQAAVARVLERLKAPSRPPSGP